MTTLLSNTYQSLPNFNLDKVVNAYEGFAKNHPVFKIAVIIANHALRVIPMIALMQVLPYSPIANCALMAGGSLFYRVTIERLCPLRFALLSCFGAAAFEFAKLNAFGFAQFVPLAVYAVSVIHTAYYANEKMPKKPTTTTNCCG